MLYRVIVGKADALHVMSYPILNLWLKIYWRWYSLKRKRLFNYITEIESFPVYYDPFMQKHRYKGKEVAYNVIGIDLYNDNDVNLFVLKFRNVQHL